MAFILHNFRLATQHRLLSTVPYRFLSTEQSTDSKSVDKENTNKINISDSCTLRLQEICNDGTFLRVTVEGGGCSGFQYKFDLDKKINDDDLIFERNNTKVVIDSISLEYCTGATIDYHTELIRSGFRILANPKAEHGCSCGASFSIKVD